MVIKQLSVFLENKSGRLTEVLETLGKEKINIIALSIADTSEFGILRLLVPDPEKVKTILKEKSFTVNLSDVISIVTPNEAGYYARALHILSDIDISIEYTYAFTIGKKSVIVLRTIDTAKAIETFEKHDFELLKANDLYKLSV